jgi:hypothetical protein
MLLLLLLLLLLRCYIVATGYIQSGAVHKARAGNTRLLGYPRGSRCAGQARYSTAGAIARERNNPAQPIAGQPASKQLHTYSVIMILCHMQ